jgi:hypothetical protein
MFSPFFALAAQSPTRQANFRRIVSLHMVLLTGACWSLTREAIGRPAILLGHVALVAGIVEGALLIGWRLTQLPRSQALEFLLVSPLRPPVLFLAEVSVGLWQLFLVTLAGLPLFVLCVADGRLDPFDPLALMILPFTWGAITGVGLTVWAFEPRAVRRWGERIVLGMVLLYLVVGVLAAENLRAWLDHLPADVGLSLLRGFAALHTHNPFGVVRYWLENHADIALDRALGLQAVASLVLLVLLVRGAQRLQPHFRERHYQPVRDVSNESRGCIGTQPLSWWAIKRVTEYSGRINLWLAGGFGTLYALYLLAGSRWPSWLGQRVFQLCDEVGGVAGLTTGLVLLAAVPAAFQYGLWDSSAQDRCRRLELLLLTRLEAIDYWRAAGAAAWRRGRGYLGVALAVVAGGLFRRSFAARATQLCSGECGAVVVVVFRAGVPRVHTRHESKWTGFSAYAWTTAGSLCLDSTGRNARRDALTAGSGLQCPHDHRYARLAHQPNSIGGTDDPVDATLLECV